MRRAKKIQAAVLLFAFVFSTTVGRAATLSLQKSFIDSFKNKATVVTVLNVDVHPPSPHRIKSSGDDGDIHMAGRDILLKLPLVAEIINARLEPAALKLLKESSPDQPINVTGVWRIWFEHVGKDPQVQGTQVPAPTTSNPDHVCEIHPITKFGAADVLDSFVEIKDANKSYQAYPASTAFPFFETLKATIEDSGSDILITSRQSKYNYTEFDIELAGKPKDVGDGYIVLANVFDHENPEEGVTAKPRRMIFVKGTPPAKKLLELKKGDTVHVLGIPRVNLAEVSAIAAKKGKQPVDTLPYEMIIVALLPD